MKRAQKINMEQIGEKEFVSVGDKLRINCQWVSVCLCTALLLQTLGQGWVICLENMSLCVWRWPFQSTFSDASTRVSSPAASSPSSLFFSPSLFWWYVQSCILHAESVPLPPEINSTLPNWITFRNGIISRSSQTEARARASKRVCLCVSMYWSEPPGDLSKVTHSVFRTVSIVSHPHSSWGTSCPHPPPLLSSSVAQTGDLRPLWGPRRDLISNRRLKSDEAGSFPQLGVSRVKCGLAHLSIRATKWGSPTGGAFRQDPWRRVILNVNWILNDSQIKLCVKRSWKICLAIGHLALPSFSTQLWRRG